MQRMFFSGYGSTPGLPAQPQKACRLRAANADSQLSSAGRGNAAVGLIPSSGVHLSSKKEMSLFCSKLMQQAPSARDYYKAWRIPENQI